MLVFKLASTYLAFYGLGLPLFFVPTYLARSKELVEVVAHPDLLSRYCRGVDAMRAR